MREEEVLKSEIEWHKSKRGTTGDESYEVGFLAGLKQAMELITTMHNMDETELCECGHEIHVHKLYDEPYGCIVDLLSDNPCACKQFRPTRRAADCAGAGAF